jgi:hypothetical protein
MMVYNILDKNMKSDSHLRFVYKNPIKPIDIIQNRDHHFIKSYLQSYNNNIMAKSYL